MDDGDEVVFEAGNEFELVAINLSQTTDDSTASLTLRRRGPGEERVRVECTGVRRLKVTDWPFSTGKSVSLMAYDVSRRQLEGIRFVLSDYEDDSLSIECDELTVVKA
jgi:hypothetical protein